MLFVALSFFIVAYAMGWRYNFKNSSLVRVGAIYLDSTPADAHIYLDGVLAKKTTPDTINNLQPNIYSLEITKEGYLSWKTNAVVAYSALTRLQNIFLVKVSDPPNLAVSGNFIDMSSSPNKEMLGLFGKNELTILRIKDGSVINTKIFPADISSIDWSFDSMAVLVTLTDNEFIYYTPINSEIVNLNEGISQPVEKANWSRKNNHTVIAYTVSSVYSLNVSEAPVPILPPVGLLYTDNQLFFTSDGEKINVTKNGKLINSLSSHSASPLQIFNVTDNLIGLTDSASKTGYIYNIKTNQFIVFAHPIKNIIPDQTANALLVTNDNEIWRMDTEQGSVELLNRTAMPLMSADWALSGHYLSTIHSLNELKVNEIDRIAQNTYSFDIPHCTKILNFDAYTKSALLCETGMYFMRY
ncbi:MAG: PEGA domain-containing protein [Patescibacteria group bacterium]